MTLAAFLKKRLKRRGTQSRLALALQVSRSTITWWRHGGKPSFTACLQLADHFEVPPGELLSMVGDPEYDRLYQRFCTEPPPRPSPDRQDPAHRELHRKLQLILDAGSRDAEIVAAVVEMAARQVEARALLKNAARGGATLAEDAIGAAMRTLLENHKGRRDARTAKGPAKQPSD